MVHQSIFNADQELQKQQALVEMICEPEKTERIKRRESMALFQPQERSKRSAAKQKKNIANDVNGQTETSSSQKFVTPSKNVHFELKHRIHAHEGGCNAISFGYGSGMLFSGGKDGKIKIWNTKTGLLERNVASFDGYVTDLTPTSDHKFVVAAINSEKLLISSAETGEVNHVFTGDGSKLSAIYVSKESNRYVVSVGFDQHLKIWDLQEGECLNSYFLCKKECNSVCMNMDEDTICTGHVDGKLRFWSRGEVRPMIKEVGIHSKPITSICQTKNWNIIMTSGIDNWHGFIDVRSKEVCEKFRIEGGGKLNKSCVSLDDNFVAVGCGDGSVHVWSRLMRSEVCVLNEKSGGSVLSCSWSDLGVPFASADENGSISVWN